MTLPAYFEGYYILAILFAMLGVCLLLYYFLYGRKKTPEPAHPAIRYQDPGGRKQESRIQMITHRGYDPTKKQCYFVEYYPIVKYLPPIPKEPLADITGESGRRHSV